MERIRETHLFKYKIIIIILYLIIGILGLPLLFIFPPRKFLFKDDSEDDENKKYLFQNFVSEIYDNINKPLINNITLTKDNEECPKDYETLKIGHQYYGNFLHFYGNSSFCLKRNNNKEWSFSRILEKNEQKCESKKKSCGIINRSTNILLCINEDEWCPLNDLIYNNKPGDPSFEISNTGVYFIPLYDQNENKPLIIDVDFIYKYDSCLEKFQRLENIECEFVDNDECFIKDKITSNKIDPKTLPKEVRLTPFNLIKLNVENNEAINHDYCVGAQKEQKTFETFSKGYVNFNKKELDNFLEEFKQNEKDPLSQICETYKLGNDSETLFYLFACILFMWSSLQFIFQILIFFLKDKNILILIIDIFLWNGIFLFFAKLICLGVLIVNHYLFYLKFKNVYLKIENDPRNEILNKYKNLRAIFITKIFIIWIVGIIIITLELIILSFGITSNSILIEQIKYANEIEKKERLKKIYEKPNDGDSASRNLKFNKDENKMNYTKTTDFIIKEGQSPHNSVDIDNPYKKKITLTFQIKSNADNNIKNYVIKVELKEVFYNIEKRLKQEYPELKDIEMGYFRNDSIIINKEKSVEENKIKNNEKITVGF